MPHLTLNPIVRTLVTGCSFPLQVDGKRFKVKNILIAVGGRPSKLPIPGAELCITSDEALELPEAPKWVWGYTGNTGATAEVMQLYRVT